MENKTKKISLGFVLAIALAGFVMRSPITTLPMILENLAQRLHVNPANLGILTTIPLVIFMVVSNFAAKTVAWLGLKRTLTMALAMIFVGGGIRVVNQFELVVLGTILIGLGIAHLNVLMPAFLMAYVPNKIALYTTAYSLVMMFGVAVFNLVTAPIVHFAGVTAVMLVLLVVSGLALLVWLISMNRAQAVGEVGHQPQPKMPQKKQLNAWRQLRAWPFLVVFGGKRCLTIHLWPGCQL
ncbi:CynX/NimT family MFS transporter [Weissella diestrammenae]|uniref:MFS transporter n=1 Tax=Weissella diestrammenae TaxID=1162633 RepID=UPI0030B81E1E